jgi:hypothetical protein
MPYGDEAHRQAYLAQIRARIGARPGQAVGDYQLEALGFWQLLNTYGPTSRWRIAPPPPPLPDAEGTMLMTQSQRKESYIEALKGTYPMEHLQKATLRELQHAAWCHKIEVPEAQRSDAPRYTVQQLRDILTWHQQQTLAPWLPPALALKVQQPTAAAAASWEPPAIALRRR